MKLFSMAAVWISMASSPATELAPGVFLLPGQLVSERSPDGNTVLLRGPAGRIVVDTGRGGEHTEDILRFLADSGAEPRAVAVRASGTLSHALTR
ncbi:MAG: hypothetical protein ACRD21_11815 [Vicinamibacteria bacterium]